MSDSSDDSTPAWAQGGLAALLLVALIVYAVALFADADIGERFSRAGQAVGAIAIAFTLYVSLQQQAEQRRVFGLGRLADLRREYARLVAAAYNVFTDHVDQLLAHEPEHLEPTASPPSYLGVHTELTRMQMQLKLHDRSVERRDIVEDDVNCLLLERNAVTLVMELRTSMLRMKRTAEALGASMKIEGYEQAR